MSHVRLFESCFNRIKNKEFYANLLLKTKFLFGNRPQLA